MQISVSDLLPFLDCEYKGRVRYTHQMWVPPTDAMRLGTHMHAVAAWMRKPTDPAIGFVPKPVLPLEFIAFQPLEDALMVYLARRPFELLAVEQPFKLPLIEGSEVVGRVDGIIEYDGIYDLQYKTVGKGKDLGRELEKVRMSPHEITYRKMMRHSGIDVAGTFVILLRTYLTKKQKEEKIPLVQAYPLAATEEEDEAAWVDVEAAFKRFARSKSAIKNWAACFGSWGQCPLLQHCHNKADVATLLTSPLVDRYTDLTADPALDLALGEG